MLKRFIVISQYEKNVLRGVNSAGVYQVYADSGVSAILASRKDGRCTEGWVGAYCVEGIANLGKCVVRVHGKELIVSDGEYCHILEYSCRFSQPRLPF